MRRGQFALVPVTQYQYRPYWRFFKWQKCDWCENDFRRELGRRYTIVYETTQLTITCWAATGRSIPTPDMFSYAWRNYHFCASCVAAHEVNIKEYIANELRNFLIFKRQPIKELQCPKSN